MANKIQLRRGLAADLPTLAAGEPAFCTDTKELFIGDGTVNTIIGEGKEHLPDLNGGSLSAHILTAWRSGIKRGYFGAMNFTEVDAPDIWYGVWYQPTIGKTMLVFIYRVFGDGGVRYCEMDDGGTWITPWKQLATTDNPSFLGSSSFSGVANFKNDHDWTSALFGGKDGSDIVGLGNVAGSATIQGVNSSVSAGTNLLINPFGGNIGVGTNAPQGKLHVTQDNDDGSHPQLLIGGNSGDNLWKFMFIGYNTAGDGYGFITPVHNGVTWTNLSLCPEGGNVGIGNNNPESKLHIAGWNDDSDHDQLTISGNDASKKMLIGYNTYGDGYGYIEPIHTGIKQTNLCLCPVAGHVGIGTSNPIDKLHVEGGTIVVKGNSSAPNGAFSVVKHDAGADYDNGSAFQHWNGTIDDAKIVLGGQKDTYGDSRISIQTNGSERVAITKDGSTYFAKSINVNEGATFNNPNGWISANLGGSEGTDRVVAGDLQGVATIGAHSGALDAWKNLAINPFGGNVGIGTNVPDGRLTIGMNYPDYDVSKPFLHLMYNNVSHTKVWQSSDGGLNISKMVDASICNATVKLHEGIVIDYVKGANYSEGIRINRNAGAWGGVFIGGPEGTTSGSDGNMWGLCRDNNNNFMIFNNTAENSIFRITKNKNVGINLPKDTEPDHTLTVYGSIFGSTIQCQGFDCWGSDHIMIGGRAVYAPIVGDSTFAGTAGRTITHNLGTTNYTVDYILLDNPWGYLGEVWFSIGANSFTIYNSGIATTAFRYKITRY